MQAHPLTKPDVSTTSRSRPVMSSSSCRTSSSNRASLMPLMYQGEPLSARIIPYRFRASAIIRAIGE